jgi:hypothetical protein
VTIKRIAAVASKRWGLRTPKSVGLGERLAIHCRDDRDTAGGTDERLNSRSTCQGVGLGVYKALQVSETPDVSIMTLRRHRSRTRTLGPAMVEFALVVPVMLFDRR